MPQPFFTGSTPAIYPATQLELEPAEYTSSLSSMPSAMPSVDAVLEELRSFIFELAAVARSVTPFHRPSIPSDKILYMEHQILDLVHDPFVSQDVLDHSCAIAALVYMRSSVRDSLCRSRQAPGLFTVTQRPGRFVEIRNGSSLPAEACLDCGIWSDNEQRSA